MKTYDDMFINTYKIIDFLYSSNLLEYDLACGSFVDFEAPALRGKERYAIDINEYPYEKYPPYCRGSLNLMRTTLAMQIYAVSNMVS